ncbi:hypothetical protein HF861_03245 [Faecalicoccus pleomorphus]|uniref:SAP domain-containing protein n=1 Tax=Faecalicoccus pleomorphus TaxID=1323 RepID=A0A7X9RI10_9FIRM|nr:hypothetical protein [Faecalicoccus pleomorphus]
MDKRPEFCEIKSYDDFSRYYWYRAELSEICKNLGIDYTGTKQELNYNIEEYFKGSRIKKKHLCHSKRICKEISLDCPLLDCEFSFNSKFRSYFSKLTGIDNFKFTANMATAWRKVKKDHDITFTIQDMLDVYNKNSDYEKYDNSTCEWNQFLKDFCADKKNSIFQNKLKVASVLWKKLEILHIQKYILII